MSMNVINVSNISICVFFKNNISQNAKNSIKIKNRKHRKSDANKLMCPKL